MMITISSKMIKQILREGEAAYPNECCGILFGRVIDEEYKIAETMQSIPNSFDEGETYHRFLITPEQMLKAEWKARSENRDIVGFYHSHPDCPAVASEYDREHALPIYSYLITSVRKQQAAEVRSWQLMNGKEFYEERMSIV